MSRKDFTLKEILEKIYEVAMENFCIERNEIHLDSVIKNLGTDSITSVSKEIYENFLVKIEEEFNIKFEHKEPKQIITIQHLFGLVLFRIKK